MIKSLVDAGVAVKDVLYLKTAFTLYGSLDARKDASDTVLFAVAIASMRSISNCVAIGKSDFNSNDGIVYFYLNYSEALRVLPKGFRLYIKLLLDFP